MMTIKKTGMLLMTLVTLGGCSTISSMGGSGYPTYAADLANKTIRSTVVLPEFDPSARAWSKYHAGPGLLFRGSWGDVAKQYRWAPTYTHTGSHHYAGYRMPSYSLVPDQLPLLEEGDIVDVLYLEDQYGFDFNNLIANKVVRLVCKNDDKACIKKIKSENEWGEVAGYPVPPEDLSKFTYTPNKSAYPKKD